MVFTYTSASGGDWRDAERGARGGVARDSKTNSNGSVNGWRLGVSQSLFDNNQSSLHLNSWRVSLAMLLLLPAAAMAYEGDGQECFPIV